jgi:predicted transcriptional regulator
LEGAVLRVLWDANGRVAAKDIRGALVDADGRPALTTVLTVLDRLVAKGFAERHTEVSGTLTFTAVSSESAHVARGMMASLLASRDREAALLTFAGALSAKDIDRLRRALGTSPSDVLP